MKHKLFVFMIALAIMVVMLPSKSAHAANRVWGPSEPATPVVIGDLPWKEKIQYRLNFEIGVDVLSYEIAPAGTNVWTSYIKHSDGLPYHESHHAEGCYSTCWDLFYQDLYGDVDTFDIRINGVIWKNVRLYGDADISLGYTEAQGPIVLASRIQHNNYYW